MESSLISVGDHLGRFSEAVKNSRQQQIEQNESLLEEVLGSFDERRAQAVRRGIEGKCSNWLNVVSVAHFNFNFN